MRVAALCMVALVAGGPAVTSDVLAKGGSSTTSSTTNANPAELRKAVQCAGLFGFLGGQVESSSPQYAAISARRSAWVDYATLAAGGDRNKAQGGAISEAAFLNGKFRELGSDLAKFQEYIASSAKQCENSPPASLPTAVAVAKPSIRQPSAETLRTSENKMECAGFYRYFEASNRPIPSLAGGTSQMFIDRAIKERPDLSPQQIAANVESYRVKWDNLFKKASEDHQAALRSGGASSPKNPEGFSELSNRCDEAAYFYAKAKK
jgi:hypothetical protein